MKNYNYNRILKLIDFYQIELPINLLGRIIWNDKFKDFSEIKNENIKEYKTNKYFYNQIYQIEPYVLRWADVEEEVKNVEALMYYYVNITILRYDYGDAVYNTFHNILYYEHGI